MKPTKSTTIGVTLLDRHSYQNIAFGVGAGHEFGLNKDVNQQLTPFDHSTSVFGYDFKYGDVTANHDTVGVKVTLGVVEVGVNVDVKRFFGLKSN